MATVVTLARICSDVYNDRGVGAIDGYKRLAGIPSLERVNNTGSSFFGAVYDGGHTAVIAYRGSLEWADWTDADVSIAAGRFPINQLGDAFAFFNRARDILFKTSRRRLIVTGHSLGGGLAQLVAGHVTSSPVIGVTFNAPGTASLRGIIRVTLDNGRNVFNWRAKRDPVSLTGAHVGHGPMSIDGAGAHPIGPLIAALLARPTGGIRF